MRKILGTMFERIAAWLNKRDPREENIGQCKSISYYKLIHFAFDGISNKNLNLVQLGSVWPTVGVEEMLQFQNYPSP